MQQIKSKEQIDGWFGATSHEFFNGYKLAIEAFGDNSFLPAISAFPYLVRRFGYPLHSILGDSCKLATYYLSTKDSDVGLMINIGGSPLNVNVGAIWSNKFHSELTLPKFAWINSLFEWWLNKRHPEIIGWEDDEVVKNNAMLLFDKERLEDKTIHEQAILDIGDVPCFEIENWRDCNGPLYRINKAIFDALNCLKIVTSIRDVNIDIHGVTERYKPFVEPFKQDANKINRQYRE